LPGSGAWRWPAAAGAPPHGCRLLGCGSRDDLPQRGLDLGGVFFWNHAAVEPEGDAPGHHIGVGAPFDLAHVQVRVLDALDLRADLLVQAVLRIQRVQDMDRRLQRIHARIGNGRMGHLAVHRDFHLQASVVRR